MKYIDDTPDLNTFTANIYPKNRAWEQEIIFKKGYLIVFEGIDGSGKSTQCRILEEKLKNKYQCTSVNFIHSDFLKVPLLKAKWENADAYTFLYLYLMGLCQTYFSYVIPHLKNNEIVILDRYVQTIIVKMLPLNINRDLLVKSTSMFRKPDISFLINSQPKICMKRKLEANGRLTYWESGGPYFKSESMRLGYEPKEYQRNFIKYQTIKQKKLIEISKKKKTLIINGDIKINEISRVISKYTTDMLERKYGL